MLCRHCDVAVHVASPHSSSHQRFLITGVRVALQPVPSGGGSGGATSNGSMASDSPASNSSPEKKRFRAAAAAPPPPLELPLEVAAEGGLGLQCPWAELLATGDLDQFCYALSSEPGSVADSH